MKIRSNDYGVPPKVKPEQLQKAGTQKASFNETLQQNSIKVWHQKLDQLLFKVSEQGKRLVNNRTIPELFKYKRLVQSFLKEAVSGMYELEDHSGWTRRGTRQSLVIVKQVDENMEKLTEMLVAEEQDSLKILEQVDHIRGLLVDLYS
ncbi:hypothetical protein GGQ84_001305 [Desulfitispora alkaliphila]|uniref:YaaR family protein n=1 Tax=Desulfitispora alkaliphila TaxID=622674 RepID=UPI003D2392AB